MHYPELITQLHEAAQNKVLQLALSEHELTALPPEISHLTALTAGALKAGFNTERGTLCRIRAFIKPVGGPHVR